VASGYSVRVQHQTSYEALVYAMVYRAVDPDLEEEETALSRLARLEE